MDSKNFILAFSLSFCILYLYQYLFDEPTIAQPQKIEETKELPKTGNVVVKVNKAQSKKIQIQSSSLDGFFYTTGNEIDTVYLKNYKKDINSDENIKILGNNRYKTSVLFTSLNKISLPDDATIWEVNGNDTLTPATPVVLTWTSPEGILFEKTLRIDEKFLITVDIKIKNSSTNNINIRQKNIITKLSDDSTNNTWVSHEGGVGYLSNSLQEKTFKDMCANNIEVFKSKGGWAGLTDKYWLVAIIPYQDFNYSVTFGSNNEAQPSMILLGDEISLSPGEEKTFRVNIFVGAKEIELLDYYEKSLNIEHFDLAVDYGYLYFLTKPLSYLLLILKDYSGNIGIAILLITILIKLLLFPLANKSYYSMKKMKTIQPKLKQIQTIYADDKQRLSEEMFALYKREKVNPAGSCLPMFLQLPFMFALYKVMMITIEMRHAPFWGWIHDLSAPDPTSIFNLFGLIPITLPSFLMIGAWPLIMGFTMFIQQRMTPNVTTDPNQARMMMMLPFIFTYMMSSLSVGLIIYWTFSNILQIIQQFILDRIDNKKNER